MAKWIASLPTASAGKATPCYLVGRFRCRSFGRQTTPGLRGAVSCGHYAVLVGLVRHRPLVRDIAPPGSDGDIGDSSVDVHCSRLCATLTLYRRKPVSYPVGSRSSGPPSLWPWFPNNVWYHKYGACSLCALRSTNSCFSIFVNNWRMFSRRSITWDTYRWSYGL